MPIVDDFFNYKIPDDIKKLITKEFLSNFRDELYKISNFSLEDFYMDTLVHYESSSGWDTAFGLACISSNLDELYRYTQTLPWYDWDLFCSEVDDMLLENKLMLDGFFDDYIAEKLNLKQEDFGQCTWCGKRFLFKNMVIDHTLDYTDEDGNFEESCYYICNKCAKKRCGESESANEYYKNGLKIIKERYKK
jgi:hypothetical protein